LTIHDKVGYIQRLRRPVRDIAAEWVDEAVGAKAISLDSPLAGEEWISGPHAVLSWMTAAIETLEAVSRDADPLTGLPIRHRRDGQTIVRVYPHSLRERLLLHRFGTEAWMPRHASLAAGRDSRRIRGQRKFALVLGAGNIASIPPSTPSTSSTRTARSSLRK
jgi:hypothetical protein